MMIFFIAVFVMLYITFSAWKYARGVFITAITMASILTLANIYVGQSGMMLLLIASPVLYIVGADAVEKLRSIKLPTVKLPTVAVASVKTERIEPVVEAAPSKGEWISGKTPELSFKQPLLGDVEALPKPWL